MSKHPDVAVIGGGIIGLTTAYFLARAGLSVEVFDRADLGREASWAGAGIIPPGDPARAATPVDKLRAIGSARFPAFSAELQELTGIVNGYRVFGGIEYLQNHDRDVIELWENEGFAFERLTPARLKQLEPALGDIAGTPYLLPGCAQVRNPRHLRALIAACDKAGVQLRPREPVRDFIAAGRRVVGANLESGDTVAAGSYLVAAGAWSGGFLERLGQRPLVRPIRGQIVLLKHPQPVLTRVVMLGKEYLVPRGDGRVLVGSTEEPEAGFEKTNTATAVAALTALARRTVPALADAAVETCWAGLRPGSPDGLPFLGAVSGWANVFVATGHSRAGIQLSIGTAQVMCEVMQNRPASVPLDAFRFDRTPDTGAKSAFRS